MAGFIGLGQADALQVGGTELSEESSQLNHQAQQLFTAMEMDVRAAMDGSAPTAFLGAHSTLTMKFNEMMRWLDHMGINLSEVNAEILQSDDDNTSGFRESEGQFEGLPRINV